MHPPFDPAPLTENSVPTTAPVQIKLTARCGKRSGSVLVTASRIPDTWETEIEICLGDPRREADWYSAAHYQGCRWREVGGLTPGRLCRFRARWVRGAERGPWSRIVSLVLR